MNSKPELLRRLLKVFPTNLLKETFDLKGPSQDAVIDQIMDQHTESVIKEFACENFNYTKQHVYFYQLDNTYSVRRFIAENFPYDIIHQTNFNGVKSFYSLPEVSFTAVLSNPFEETLIKFLQPTCVSFIKDILVIQCTIMEKKIQSYFQSNRKVYEVVKFRDELNNINEILAYIGTAYSIEVLDINKGIKALWANEFIDSKHVKYKKSKSIATEAMDEDFLLKVEYPLVYQELISAPLKRTIFKYVKDDNLLCDHFTADPENGQISVPLYPADNNQILNVIDKILSRN